MELYHLAQAGKLDVHETFTEICKMFSDSVNRLNSTNVENTDKQDDGTARRVFHEKALHARTYFPDGELKCSVRPEFTRLFVYCLILGM